MKLPLTLIALRALHALASHPLVDPPDDWSSEDKIRHWKYLALGGREIARDALEQIDEELKELQT